MRKINLLYIAHKINSEQMSGVEKKIIDQIKTLNCFDINTSYYGLEHVNKFFKLLPLHSTFLNWNSCKICKNINVLYIRYFLSSYPFISFLKKVKTNNKNIKIILEIPTYPYLKELKFPRSILAIKDLFWQRYLYLYIDRIVTFSNDNYIYGIPTIKTINGIIVDNVISKHVAYNNKSINIIAVSSTEIWHGYDRFIKGLHNYYFNGGKRNIIFHIVGSGSKYVLQQYKNLIKKYSLSKNVKFYGQIYGADLDKIYNRCELAVATLGAYRIGLDLLSSIKSNEYLAKGLPIISGCNLAVVPSDFQYLLRFPNDESDIDISKVLKFYDDIYKCKETREEIITTIRKYAYNNCDMKIAIKPVADYIINNAKVTNHD